MPNRFFVEVSDEIAAKLDALPSSNGPRRSRVLEAAINSVLDEAGWPSSVARDGSRPMPSPWFVIVYDRAPVGWSLRGHVGPLADNEAAMRVVRSWRGAGHRASTSRLAKGPCLTNAAGGAWP